MTGQIKSAGSCELRSAFQTNVRANFTRSADPLEARSALRAIPCPADRDSWWRIVGSALEAGIDEEEVLAWCESGPNFNRSDAHSTIRSLARRAHSSCSGSLFRIARRYGWRGQYRHTRIAVQPSQTAHPKALRSTLSDWGRKLWRECQPIGGIAAAYLTARNCALPPADGALRWHPKLKHPSGHVGPALVALVTNALTREPISLHRTWITATGKADVQPARLYLAGHDLTDGVIRLWPDELVTYGLGIAEGIETALSLAWGFTPVWAMLDAGHLSGFKPLPGIETLAIACDNDPAGIKASRECSERWSAAGADVIVTRQEANDLNDVLEAAA